MVPLSVIGVEGIVPEEYRVRGSSISSKFEFVRVRFGTEAELQLKEQFADHEQLFPILDSSWYPFELYDEINRAIADRFFDGELSGLVEVGSYSAEKVLTSVYKAFAEGKDFVGFLLRAALLHERFYSQSQMDVTLGEDGVSAEILLRDAPTHSEADLHMAAGFYAGAAKLLGVKGYRDEYNLIQDGAHFQLRWD